MPTPDFDPVKGLYYITQVYPESCPCCLLIVRGCIGEMAECGLSSDISKYRTLTFSPLWLRLPAEKVQGGTDVNVAVKYFDLDSMSQKFIEKLSYCFSAEQTLVDEGVRPQSVIQNAIIQHHFIEFLAN